MLFSKSVSRLISGMTMLFVATLSFLVSFSSSGASEQGGGEVLYTSSSIQAGYNHEKNTSEYSLFSFAKRVDVGVNTAAAAETTNTWSDSGIGLDFAKSASTAIEIVYILLTPLVFLCGWLLSPDWTFGNIFGLRPVIHNLWILVSNVVYIIFAFALVAIAFVNIFSGGGNFAIKKALPKFLVGIIIVPFTWFIVSAVLSISNVLTAAVLKLPAQFISPDKVETYTLSIPKQCTVAASSEAKKEKGKWFYCGEKKDYQEVKISDIFNSQKGAYNILIPYVYGILDVQSIKELSDPEKLKALISGTDVGIALIVGLILFVVLGLILFALSFALFSRALHLWFIAIFSPLFGLFYFMGDAGAKKILSWEPKKYGLSIGSFISLAMVPVFVSAALSFGLLFLTASANTSVDDFDKWSFFSKFTNKWTTSTMGIPLGSDDKNFELIIEGTPLWSKDASDTASATANLAKNAIGKLILNILALVVLWMGVMAALKSNDITSAAVDPFEKFGKSIADIAKAIPQHVPIIPTPSGGMSAYGMQTAASAISNKVSVIGQSEASEIGNKIGNKISGAFGDKAAERSDKKTTQLNGMSSGDIKADKALKGILADMGVNKPDQKNSDVAKQYFNEWLGKIPENAFASGKKPDEMAMKSINEALKKWVPDAVVEVNKLLNDANKFKLDNKEIKDQQSAIELLFNSKSTVEIKFPTGKIDPNGGTLNIGGQELAYANDKSFKPDDLNKIFETLKITEDKEKKEITDRVKTMLG